MPNFKAEQFRSLIELIENLTTDADTPEQRDDPAREDEEKYRAWKHEQGRKAAIALHNREKRRKADQNKTDWDKNTP